MWDVLLDESDKLIDLDDDEDTVWSHVFGWGQSQELNEWDLHGQQGTQNVENVVSGDDLVHVFLLFRFVGNQSEENEDGDDVDNEGVSTPWSNHVKVGKGWADWPQDAASVTGLNENIESEDESEDGDTFVIVRSSDGSGHVTGNQTDEQGSKKASAMFFGDLTGQQVGGNRGERRKNRS